MQKQRIQKYYNTVVVEDLLIVYNYDNIMQLPCLTHATVNTTSKKYLLDKKIAIYAFAACFLLTGQKSVLTRAHKSIATFNLREGSLIGCKVTLRKGAMYNLMNKLVTFILPRMQILWHEHNLIIGARRAILNTGVNNFLLLPEIESFFSFFGSSTSQLVGAQTIQGFDIIWHFSVPRVLGMHTRNVIKVPRLKDQVAVKSLRSSKNSVYNLLVNQKKNQATAKRLNGFVISPQETSQSVAVSSLLVTAFQYPRINT